MSDRCPLGDDLQKYWDRLSTKERLMSFDEDGLRSFTPLPIGFQIARKIKSQTVFDCFSGVGGLSIAFACAGKQVHGIDLSHHRVQLATANAKLFNVEGRVEFICADALTALRNDLSECAVILDPPWGGTAYDELKSFKLNHFRPDGLQLLSVAFKTQAEVLMLLPKNFDMRELEQFKRPQNVVENVLNCELLSYAVLFPALDKEF